MKKLIIGFLFLFLPVFVSADKVDYTIKHYYINADLLENGDMDVIELIVLKGSFNGYIRDIVFKNYRLGYSGYESNAIYNASDIVVSEISAKKVSDVSFATLEDTDFTKLVEGKGANGGYLESYLTGGYSYKMYFKSQKEQVAFRLKYTVKDALVLHNDVGELYYTFIGEDYDDAIHDLQIRVNLPAKDESSSFKVWAHGDLAGEIYPYENAYLIAKANVLDPYSSVDIRTTFSKTLLNEKLVKKQSEETALEEIIKVEEERANVANQQRVRMRILFYGLLIFSIFHMIGLILAWIYIYFKYDKEYKSDFTNEYNREFIDDYNVEVIDYLMTKSITPNALSASIMNMIYKKNIKVEEIPSDKKKKDYTFTLVNEDGLNGTEKKLTAFLFTKVGKNNTFTSKELQNYAKSTKTCDEFSASYTSWKNAVLKDGKEQNFFEKSGKAKGIGFLFFFLAILLVILKSAFNIVSPLVFVNMTLSIIFFIYTLAFFKRTKKGNEDYVRWMAFKKFLNDFGTFDTKELPEIKLWERYMVYATIFGLADKVSKAMNVKIKELEMNGESVLYYPTFGDYYFYNSLNHLVHNAITSNTQTITAERASSSFSSGGGSGGGFSSGGGFGGGGGGGHGF